MVEATKAVDTVEEEVEEVVAEATRAEANRRPHIMGAPRVPPLK